MRTIDLLNDIDKNETLKLLVNKSILSWSVLRKLEIYRDFDVNLKMGNSITDSVFLTSEKMKVSERTVYMVKKLMETE